MIVAAKALSYNAMWDLVNHKQETLEQNSAICIASPQLEGTTDDRNWPVDSERWMNIFFEDVRPEHLFELSNLEQQLGRKIVVFNEGKADKIIDFLKKAHLRPKPETLYVNCAAGISRSGAIVAFASEMFNLDHQQIAMDNPAIVPNKLVLFTLREQWRQQSATLAYRR